MKLTININAVKNGPTTGTEDSSDTLPVKIDSRYPRTEAIVVKIQIIQSNTYKTGANHENDTLNNVTGGMATHGNVSPGKFAPAIEKGGISVVAGMVLTGGERNGY